MQWAAFYLALGTKAVNKLGFLSYLWASIVILGGFASDIKIHDYVMITLTLVFEATRWYSWLGMVALNHGTNKEPTTGYLEMRPAKTATIFYFLRGSSILAKVVITTVWFSLNGYKTSSVTLSFAMFTYFVVLYLQFIVFLLHNEMYGWWYQTWYDKKETLAKLDQHWMSFYYTAYFIAANGNIFDCFNVSEPFYSKYKAYYIPDAWNLLPSIADELISKLCKGRASGSA